MPEGSWQDSWRALEQLVASGQILAIGLLQILTWGACGHSNVMQI
jgi:aryl-alcohol dehydrogenase-like predicted oxidoreductase